MLHTRFMLAALAAAFTIVSAPAAWAAGLTVAVIDRPPTSVLMQDKASFEFPIRVHVTMPGGDIEPGGKADSNKMQIVATLEKNGKKYPAVPLAYTGHANEFGGEITLPELGSYVIDVTARDPASGDTGMLKVPVAGLPYSAYPVAPPQVMIGPAAGAAPARRPAGGGGEE